NPRSETVIGNQRQQDLLDRNTDIGSGGGVDACQQLGERLRVEEDHQILAKLDELGIGRLREEDLGELAGGALGKRCEELADLRLEAALELAAQRFHRGQDHAAAD